MFRKTDRPVNSGQWIDRQIDGSVVYRQIGREIRKHVTYLHIYIATYTYIHIHIIPSPLNAATGPLSPKPQLQVASGAMSVRTTIRPPCPILDLGVQGSRG